MADAIPLPPSAPKWSQHIPDTIHLWKFKSFISQANRAGDSSQWFTDWTLTPSRRHTSDPQMTAAHTLHVPAFWTFRVHEQSAMDVQILPLKDKSNKETSSFYFHWFFSAVAALAQREEQMRWPVRLFSSGYDGFIFSMREETTQKHSQRFNRPP